MQSDFKENLGNLMRIHFKIKSEKRAMDVAQGWECSSGIKSFLSIYGVLGAIPNNKQKKKREKSHLVQ